VPDNLPPTAKICRDVRAECAGATTDVMLDGTCSSDPENDPLTYQWSSSTGTFNPADGATTTGSFPLGRNHLSLTVSDDHSNTSEPDDGLVVIADTTPPMISDVMGSHSALWPPNHKLVPVTILASVSDICDPAPVCAITEVSSSESINGHGDGNTAPDWV